MTFYEAALRILESEGRPLHFLEITEKSIAQSLLSHVGKTPEQTMLSRLAAMARRNRDRRVIVTAKDTFALVDWGHPEDAEALAQTGVPEPHPEEALPPLRPVERHPDPRGENARAAGRGDRKRRRDEEEERGGRRRRFPPVPEVVFEILSEGALALKPEEIAVTARERGLAGEELSPEQILTALLEDNQRRIDAGRRPQFVLDKQTGQVALERAGAPSEAPPLELQAAFAAALGIPLEGGRPVLKSVPSTAEAGEHAQLALAAKTAVKDARRSLAKSLRRKLADLEAGTFEKSVVKMMHAHGFRELKVAKRSKDGPLLTARKREGSVELRYAVRILKGGSSVDRKSVSELRRDLGHYSANVGLLCTAAEIRSDAKTEATASGALVMLWCGDALAEKFLEAKIAVAVTQVELFEIDEQFFEQARVDAEEAQKRREERHREKAQREDQGLVEVSARAERPSRREEGDEDHAALQQEGVPVEATSVAPPPRPSAPAAGPALLPAGARDEEGEDGEEGDEEDSDDLAAASDFVSGAPRTEGGAPGGVEGQPGERKRRRRRRRGRRGRGNREGLPGAPGAPGAPGGNGQGVAGGPPGAPGAVSASSAPAGEGGPASIPAEQPGPEPVRPEQSAAAEAPSAPPPPPPGEGGSGS